MDRTLDHVRSLGFRHGLRAGAARHRRVPPRPPRRRPQSKTCDPAPAAAHAGANPAGGEHADRQDARRMALQLTANNGGATCSYPFCEERQAVGEMVTWVMEERRSAILTYVIEPLRARSAAPTPTRWRSISRCSTVPATHPAEGRPGTRMRHPSGTAARLLRGPALAVRGTCSQTQAQDRPQSACSRRGRACACARITRSATRR